MLRRSFHGWRIKQEIQNLTAIRTPSSPRLNSVRDSPTPLPPLFSSWQWQKNLPPTSHFRFTRQTTRSIPTGFSATAYCSRAPEPGGFTRVEDPNPNVDSLRESSVGVDDGREDDGEGLGRRRTLPEQLSSTVVVLTCMSVIGTCNVFLLRQGLSGDRIPVVSCDEPKDPYLQLWGLDGDYFESLMRNSKAVVNKLEVCRGHELRVAFEEAMKYGGKVANKLEGYPARDFRVAEDDRTPRDDVKDDEDNKDDVDDKDDEDNKDDVDCLVSQLESSDQDMSKESPTLMKTIVHG
ncbi:uncharacterized protein LOC115746805 isoform X2 [Rhodamnia argentea]|uniref:Uncharacterized protein LOC115746805 isoform X2 n=1 Tax=Rhodamnia argentea TaxID=178133 RepID=A0ABM3HNA6_9MYRT|nr:uncharacterized protein LOC115746805 isoform X2 [Rhodamnia argentea]